METTSDSSRSAAAAGKTDGITEAISKTSSDAKNKKLPRRIIRRRPKNATKQDNVFQIDPILLQKVLSASSLPTAYSFEIEKTVQRCMQLNVSHIGLQMPEGLLLYATVLSDVLQQLTPCLDHVSIFTDVTYGACCVEDIVAQQLGCQLLVHYGHSCLIPLQHTVIPCLYVFVQITGWSVQHMVECVVMTVQERHVQKEGGNGDAAGDGVAVEQQPPPIHLSLLGTVQFRHALAEAKELFAATQVFASITIPQSKPLSPGEVLGCTSPTIATPPAEGSQSIAVFLADGRFHVEATLIANPQLDACYRYDPYGQSLTQEVYDHAQMHSIRQSAIAQARSATTFGILLGTLGRQGNPAIVQRIQSAVARRRSESSCFVVLLSEILPSQLACMTNVDAWIQVACPRLSIDWGQYLTGNDTPVLNPYEVLVALGETEYQSTYPMDYYSNAGGPWANYHPDNKSRAPWTKTNPAGCCK